MTDAAPSSFQSPSSSTQQEKQWSREILLRSSYQELGTPQQVGQRFQRYLLTNPSTLTSILSVLTSHSTTNDGKTGVKDYSLAIDVHELLSHDPVLGHMLLRHPSTLLPLLEDAVVEAQREVAVGGRRLERLCGGMDEEGGGGIIAMGRKRDCWSSVKGEMNGGDDTRVHARLIHLPPHSSNCRPLISSLTSLDVGKILQLSGTIVRASKVQMYESQRAFRCCTGTSAGNSNGSRWKKKKEEGCGASFVVKADLQQWNNALCAPSRCPTPECKGSNFEVIPEGSTRSDYQVRCICSGTFLHHFIPLQLYQIIASFHINISNKSSPTPPQSNINKYDKNTYTRTNTKEIKLQESVSNRAFSSSSNQSRGGSSSGIIPRSLLIKLQHDLVDRCQPGDDVVIVGTLISHWQSDLVAMGDCNITTAMTAHSIRVVHGGEAGGDHEGSSWDCIFERAEDEGEDEDEGGSASNTSGKKRKKLGMVREEIVKEFREFWNEEENRKRPIAARNFICQSVCPTLYGMSLVKLGLLLTLIGGSRTTGDSDGTHCHDNNETISSPPHLQVVKEESEEDQCSFEDGDAPVQFNLFDDKVIAPPHKGAQGIEMEGVTHCKKKSQSKRLASSVQTRRREQSHLLLVGDPGTGKSQFLRFAAALCPRSVLTSGAGTTSAGLTCAAVREGSGKEFTLEAGALVLADRGVCAIDEFGCMAAKDRTTIHEAMEQQTLSVAKAGIVCKLNCRATVIAVTNAKGGIYDHEKTFTANIGIEPPLLSRFDLIFKLIDGSDPSKDDNVATFLLNRAIQGSGYECTKKVHNMRRKEDWTIEKLRAYIATVKSELHPSISEDASELLERHYTACRSSVDIALQVTVRFLESLIRLAQAHARLMHRGVAELDDAVSIIILMESTAATCTLDVYDESSLFQDPTITVFPEADRADIEFLHDKAKVLEKYQMQNLLSQDEIKSLTEYKKCFQDSNEYAIDTSWDTIINHNDSSIVVGTKNTIPGTCDVRNSENTQDHYGRCTQISPNFRSASQHRGNEGISLQSSNVLPTNLSHNWPMEQDSSNSVQNSLSYIQGPVTDGGDEWSDPEEHRTSPRKTKRGRKRRSAD